MPEELRLFLVANGMLVIGAAAKLSVAWLQHLTKQLEEGEDGN